MNRNKQVYLILAHNQFELLKKLCVYLDSDKNDIIIHADSRWKEFNSNKIEELLKKSRVFFLKRRPVYWGDYSQIKVTIDLLREAAKQPYSYYHLISGVDFPIKSNEYIGNFFKDNNTEYVQFENNFFNEEKYQERYMYNHYFHPGRRNIFIKAISKYMVVMQKYLRIKKTKYFKKIYKGSNWFSITDSFVRYILKNEGRIENQFKHGLCVDELFIQTLIMESPYRDNLVNSAFDNLAVSNLREIDWKRGNPHIWVMEDRRFLNKSKCLFARKFDLNVDEEIINELDKELHQ